MIKRSPAKACTLSLLALLASACSFDLTDHPASCKVTSDCAHGYVCYDELCVQGPGGSSTAGTSAGVGAGTGGHAGTHAAGTSGGGSGAGGAGVGMVGVDANVPDVDSEVSMTDASNMTDVDSGMTMGALPTCEGWKPPKMPICPAACTGGCVGGVCNIACDGVTCVSVLICPKEYACYVSCNGGNACAGAYVTCGDGPCDLSCLGGNACTSVTMNCGPDACRATCDGLRVITLNSTSSCSMERSTCN